MIFNFKKKNYIFNYFEYVNLLKIELSYVDNVKIELFFLRMYGGCKFFII